MEEEKKYLDYEGLQTYHTNLCNIIEDNELVTAAALNNLNDRLKDIENVLSDWNLTNTTSNDYIKNKPTSLPASDVSSWAKESSKPIYIASEVMSISVVNVTGNISSSCSITEASNAGKAQTIIYVNNGSSDFTVTVPTTYKTPNGAAIELTCPVGGYCEVSYLNIGGTIYARGL